MGWDEGEEDSVMSPGIFALVDSVGRGAILRQRHREIAVNVRGKQSRAGLERVLGPYHRRRASTDMHSSLEVIYIELNSYMF